MSKYSAQFKLDVIQRCLQGDAGVRAVSSQYGLDNSMVRHWLNLYGAHGQAGLEKKFTHYPAERRLQVLEHMWAHKLSYRQTAAVFNIRSAACIPIWERCYHSGGIDALMPRQRGKPKQMPITQPPPPASHVDDETRSREELLAEVNFLRMENAYLKKLKALVQQQREQQTTARTKRK
jgi:transposase